jgi:hypothetical protein
MEPLIHTPSDTDPGLPRLVTPDRNHVLDLRGREGVTDYGLDSMYRTGLMKGVRAVDLGYCERITDEALVLLSGIDTLTRLYLDGCWRITARGLTSLISLEELRVLDVSSCDGFDDVALRSVLSIPGLKILKLRKTAVTRQGFLDTEPVARLDRLDVRGCRRIQPGDVDQIARHLHLGRHDIIHE